MHGACIWLGAYDRRHVRAPRSCLSILLDIYVVNVSYSMHRIPVLLTKIYACATFRRPNLANLRLH